MNKDTKKIISSMARNRVLMTDDDVAKTIYNIRGENMGDKEVHEHVERAIKAAQSQLLYEAKEDSFIDLPDEDDEEENNDENDIENNDIDGAAADADRNSEIFNNDDTPIELPDDDNDWNNEEDNTITITDDNFKQDTQDMMDTIRDAQGNMTITDITRAVGQTIGAVTSDYLQVIDFLYKKCQQSSTHRDVYNLLSFLRFEATASHPITNVTAAFAFLDIPNVDLSMVFSDITFNSDFFMNVDGLFYRSTFNNDSILNWPWKNLAPAVEIFTGCPYSNLELNRISGRRLVKVEGVTKSKEAQVDAVAGRFKSVMDSL